MTGPWEIKHADTVVKAAKAQYEQACATRAELIRKAISDREMSASQIARVLGVSRARIGQIIHG